MAELKKVKREDTGKAGGAPGPGLSEEALAEAVEKLEQVQDELEKLNEKASEEILKVEQKFNQERQPVFEKRNKIIAKVQDFWPTVFLSHAELISLLTEEDHGVLEFLREVLVEDFPDIRSGHTISLTFAENPYFEDSVLKKTYKFSDEGTVKITGTKIRWKPGKDITQRKVNGEEKKAGKKRDLEEDEGESFFKWFDVPEAEQESEAVEDEIADLIREDLWPNPLRFYTQEGIDEGAEGEEGDDDEDEGDEDEGEGGEDEGAEDGK